MRIAAPSPIRYARRSRPIARSADGGRTVSLATGLTGIDFTAEAMTGFAGARDPAELLPGCLHARVGVWDGAVDEAVVSVFAAFLVEEDLL